MTPDKVEAATMPANKMPEMPEYLDSLSGSQRYLASEYGHACYLAGIEAAKACVPERRNDALGLAAVEWNACRATTLTNLTALEQEAKK